MWRFGVSTPTQYALGFSRFCVIRTASLLNFAFLTEPLHLRFFLTLRLLCLTVLVLGALLSSFLEEALYKCSI